jgi:hypothetical protein
MEIKYYLDFLIKNPYVFFIHNEDDIRLNKSKFIDTFNLLCKDYNKFIISYPTETFRSETIDILQELVSNKKDNEIYISHSSSKVDNNFAHPLLSLLFWQTINMRENISWASPSNIKLFDKKYYSGEYIKNNTAILSVRKSNYTRDYLFSKIKDIEFNGILRYANWPLKESANNQVSKFPTFLELVNEYKSSFLSFIIESEKGTYLNHFTEKTLIAFLTKTIPLFYNNKNYSFELEQLGFYTFNEYFDISPDYEKMDSESERKQNDFVNALKVVNTLSIDEIYNNIYLKNIDKINHNYNLAYKYLIELNIPYYEI